MKRWILILALTFGACHAPVTVTTPQGKIAYTADQVVLRVNELENAAIQAQATNAIPVQTARTIVEWCVSADKTLASTPNGWPVILQTGWMEVKGKVGLIANPAIVAAMGAVDVVLATQAGVQ